MKKSVLPLILCIALGCASTSNTRTHGNSSASMRVGDIITTTSTMTYPDGRVEVTVVDTCEDCNEEEAVGGEGSDKLYDAVITLMGAFLSIASIVVQILK